ncbi:hypothetical protein [Sunxiuqinia elliptica]|uniref:Uncharacterized protein n=1 Tax=Sunxiuqinia elliptica TaxID=655355 RepID=A0A4R6H1L1_9BACT|nr:hypothetical protein [Sunxiuqinia elliptica]TDO01251.1 hypothetical protein DET52_105106 [Sunxiuqinia elliptica]TDO57762.1 hypothetical protein DET65_3356 [Sunxiuqinia elliptica]
MKNSATKVLIAFVLGMLAMFVLDMVFHFNNSVEKQLEREANKAQKKIENIFK